MVRAVVGSVLEAMSDLQRLPPVVVDGSAEAVLRGALAHHLAAPAGRDTATTLGCAAVRTACAYLAVHAWTDARQALRAAVDHFDDVPTAPSPTPHEQDVP